MKKFFVIGLVVISLITCSCTRNMKSFTNNFTYESPKPKTLYTVIQNKTKIEHLRCVYWSTEDDDSIFINQNGKKIFVNGSSIIIEE